MVGSRRPVRKSTEERGSSERSLEQRSSGTSCGRKGKVEQAWDEGRNTGHETKARARARADQAAVRQRKLFDR